MHNNYYSLLTAMDSSRTSQPVPPPRPATLALSSSPPSADRPPPPQRASSAQLQRNTNNNNNNNNVNSANKSARASSASTLRSSSSAVVAASSAPSSARSSDRPTPPKQTPSLAPRLAQDFSFTVRKLLRPYLLDPLAAPLDEQVFIAFVSSVATFDPHTVAPSSSPPASSSVLPLDRLLQTVFDDTNAEVVVRLGRTEVLALRSLPADHEELVYRVAKQLSPHVGLVMEISVETELWPRSTGTARSDALRGCVIGGDGVMRAVTKEWPPPRPAPKRTSIFAFGHLSSNQKLFGAAIPDEGVPPVLHYLLQGIVVWGGHETEGILRVSAQQKEVARVKEHLMHRLDIEASHDPHVWAALLKDWLLSLPSRLLAAEHLSVPAIGLLRAVKNPMVLRELLLFCAFLEQYETTTRMTLDNLFLMMTPCLMDMGLVADPRAQVQVMTNAKDLLVEATRIFAKEYPHCLQKQYYELVWRKTTRQMI